MSTKHQFQLEGVEGYFEGYTEGGRWNGWATPQFPLASAKAIVAAMDEQLPDLDGTTARYDEENDLFVIRWADDDDQVETYGPVELGDETVYPLGSGGWCWNLREDFCDVHDDWTRLEHMVHPEKLGDVCIGCGAKFQEVA